MEIEVLIERVKSGEATKEETEAFFEVMSSFAGVYKKIEEELKNL